MKNDLKIIIIKFICCNIAFDKHNGCKTSCLSCHVRCHPVMYSCTEGTLRNLLNGGDLSVSFFHRVVSHAYFRQLLFVNTVWTFAVRIFPGVLYVCTWLAIPVRCFDNRQSLGECRATCRNRKAGRYFQNSAWHHVTLTILQSECQAKTLALFTRHIGARKIINWVV